MATKDEIRRSVRQLKRHLSEKEKTDAAERCFAGIERCPEFAAARSVLVYASLPDEISTAAFIERWADRKELLLPRVNGDDLDILPYRREATAEGAFGITEPTGSDCRPIDDVDLVIVPGMAFDRQGNRLGRGRGYYDRLLHAASCPLIAAAYSVQIVDSVPAEPHDVKIPIIVTEKETIRTS